MKPAGAGRKTKKRKKKIFCHDYGLTRFFYSRENGEVCKLRGLFGLK